METTIVTGGAGFIGSNLCRRLHEEGDYVICIDNLSSGSEKNIKDLQKSSRFETIIHDVTHPIDLKADKIYHLACPASPVYYQKDPIATSKTLFMGSLNMLEVAKANNARILLASTSEIYGEPLIHPQVEEYHGNVEPNGIRSCYDEGKRMAESLFFDYHRTFGTEIRVVRIFNTYGPGMLPDDGRVVSNFIVQALQEKDLTVYGDGSQTRSLCFVDDTVEAMLRMMEIPNITGPVNIGNDHELCVKDIAEHIIRLTGSSSRMISRPLPEDDPTRRRPDITKARKILGWEPSVSLDEGLIKTIDYFRELVL